MNAFGIDDDRYEISKGLTAGLKMAGAAGKGIERTSVTGGTKKTGELARRMAAGKKTGGATPHGLFSRTQLLRMKEDPFE